MSYLCAQTSHSVQRCSGQIRAEVTVFKLTLPEFANDPIQFLAQSCVLRVIPGRSRHATIYRRVHRPTPGGTGRLRKPSSRRCSSILRAGW